MGAVALKQAGMLVPHLFGDLEHRTMARDDVVRYVQYHLPALALLMGVLAPTDLLPQLGVFNVLLLLKQITCYGYRAKLCCFHHNAHICQGVTWCRDDLDISGNPIGLIIFKCAELVHISTRHRGANDVGGPLEEIQIADVVRVAMSTHHIVDLVTGYTELGETFNEEVSVPGRQGIDDNVEARATNKGRRSICNHGAAILTEKRVSLFYDIDVVVHSRLPLPNRSEEIDDRRSSAATRLAD